VTPLEPLEPVVTIEWLLDRLDEIVVVDTRHYNDGRSGRAAYDAGHIPGAVFVDVDHDLAAPPSPAAGRHPFPTPEAFAAAMERAGIGDGDTVVAYDDAGGAFAARLVWMLRVTGHRAALLDGGLAAWTGPLATEATARPSARFTAVPWPADRLVDIATVAAAAADPQQQVIDARAAERYRGEVEPLDPRAGHIPGAVNLPYSGNLDQAGRWRSPEELRARFEPGPPEPIVYCGSGVTACHDLLAIERAGLPPGRLYSGSWSQWSSDPDRPAALGDTPPH
jgi:thiosulfate/3-mercaptopyruvate sulfurtransferase